VHGIRITKVYFEPANYQGLRYTGFVAAPGRNGNGNPLLKLAAESANAPDLRECVQFFSREKQWINETHLKLCRIPAATFFEQKRAEWMLEQFLALGCEASIDRGGNVVAFLGKRGDRELIAVTAHLDTVLAPRNPESEITFGGGDGRFHGPGVSDNGAGLTALLALAKAMRTCPESMLTERELDRPAIAFVANVGEEGEGNLGGMRYLCRQSPLADRLAAFVVLDGPGTDHITCQALASRRFDVTVSGPGGHSWSDYGMGNPVHALSRAIALFADTRVNANGSPRSSFNFGILEGGMSINSIPTSARTKVDIRSESAQKLDEMSALLTSCVERAVEIENDRATGGRVSARVRDIGTRPGGRLADDAPILNVLRAVDAHLGIRAQVDCASTDANIPLSLGMQAVSIGAGGQGGGAHTPAEWYSAEGRELGLKRILLALTLLLQTIPQPLSAGTAE
jgi:tripeptide aminopeptidase